MGKKFFILELYCFSFELFKSFKTNLEHLKRRMIGSHWKEEEEEDELELSNSNGIVSPSPKGAFSLKQSPNTRYEPSEEDESESDESEEMNEESEEGEPEKEEEGSEGESSMSSGDDCLKRENLKGKLLKEKIAEIERALDESEQKETNKRRESQKESSNKRNEEKRKRKRQREADESSEDESFEKINYLGLNAKSTVYSAERRKAKEHCSSNEKHKGDSSTKQQRDKFRIENIMDGSWKKRLDQLASSARPSPSGNQENKGRNSQSGRIMAPVDTRETMSVSTGANAKRDIPSKGALGSEEELMLRVKSTNLKKLEIEELKKIYKQLEIL